MGEKNIQEKIIENFINVISKSSKFTSKEIDEINNIISSSTKADKMAENILESIGDNTDENT